MHSSLPGIERARPLLGTTVSVRVEGLAEADAHHAVDEAFAEIALVHRLMSFHEAESDLSSLNREAHRRSIEVHPLTFEVLQHAIEFSDASDGVFDITVAQELVANGLLPSPSGLIVDPSSTWRDVQLQENHHVRFRRPFWIDLGGIAKGFAVDRAIERLKAAGAVQASVNAGGDLRIFGPHSERVRLSAPHSSVGVPVLDIENAAVASSGGPQNAHVDGASRSAIPSGRFVSIVAETCIVADALTKIVLALEEQSEAILEQYRASAHLYELRRGWRHFGA